MAPCALLSVTDLNGIVPLAEALHRTMDISFSPAVGPPKFLRMPVFP